MSERTSKIAIIGAGSVGATIAYACMIRGVGKQIALYDTNARKVQAEVLDLAHGLQFVPAASIEGSDDLAVCAGADIVVVAAGARQKPGQTRMDLAEKNTAICRRLAPEITRVAPDAILLLVTNPVDVLTYAMARLSGLPTRRVIGSGTVLDSSRFRYLIAQHCKVAVQNVHAFIAGEHGDSEAPLWSTATIANIPLHDWAVVGHGTLGPKERSEIFQAVKSSAYQIIEGKGATNYAVGLATASIIEAIIHDENRVLPVSAVIDGFHGIRDVCISVPSVVNRAGVESPLPVRLSEAEETALRASAAKVREALKALGF